MNQFPAIDAVPKTGDELLTNNGRNIDYKLHDFWVWSVSDILSNATRGRFAEFIVGTAVGLKPENLRDEWDAFDLLTSDGIKIEVKSAAYIQSWNQKNYSSISFKINKARYWDASTNMQHDEPKRHADLFVFCLLKHKDQETVNQLKLEQWEFYVVPTFVLDNYQLSQSSIRLNSLQKLTQPKVYDELNTEITNSFEAQKSHQNNLSNNL